MHGPSYLICQYPLVNDKFFVVDKYIMKSKR